MRFLVSLVLVAALLAGCETTSPEEELRAETQRVVVVEFVVDTEGHPQDIRVVSEDDPALALAAVEAVRGWTFPPATVEGEAVNSRVRLPVVFPADFDPGENLPQPDGAGEVEPETDA